MMLNVVDRSETGEGIGNHIVNLIQIFCVADLKLVR